MGNCCSKKSNESETHPPARPVKISRPYGAPIRVPEQHRDDNDAPLPVRNYDLDRATLHRALELMAQYLAQRKEPLTVVTVGGAVNTILLRSRQTTHDIDFFGVHLNNHKLRLLNDAARYAAERCSAPLGTNWFNNETVLFLGQTLHREVTEAAYQQNDVVFQRPGLKILAAPWNYAFCAKIARLVSGVPRSYDLADAVTYLRRYITQTGGGSKPVKVATIEGWARQFRHETKRDFLLRNVNSEYRRRYRCDGIV